MIYLDNGYETPEYLLATATNFQSAVNLIKPLQL